MSDGKPASIEPDQTQLVRAHRMLQSNPKQALVDLRSLAERGSVLSMMYLGDAYKLGEGVGINLIEAERWYRAAAENGSLLGYYYLGRVYLKLKKFEEARTAFEFAAKENYAPALHYLGRMYSFGYGVERNTDKAKEYLERATAQGSVFSKRRLASLFMQENSNFSQRVRGVLLFAGSYVDFFFVVCRDGLSSERLR